MFEEMAHAVEFVIQQIITMGTFVGLAADAAAAVRQAGEEAGDDLNAFAADVRDIQAIVAANRLETSP